MRPLNELPCEHEGSHDRQGGHAEGELLLAHTLDLDEGD